MRRRRRGMRRRRRGIGQWARPALCSRRRAGQGQRPARLRPRGLPAAQARPGRAAPPVGAENAMATRRHLEEGDWRGPKRLEAFAERGRPRRGGNPPRRRRLGRSGSTPLGGGAGPGRGRVRWERGEGSRAGPGR